MCGIVGMVTKNRYGFNHHNLKAFEQLLFLDTLRGDDSTGVFAVNNLGNVGIAKAAVTGEAFLKTDEWKKFNGELFKNGWCVIGHNRKATRGSVNDENAHPFWIDDKLVLVHNGSYFGDHKQLAKTEVDSHAIAHILAEHGDSDVEGALKRINAAYALVWYDTENKKLNIIRNDQRPLHFAETDDAWYFASEYGMLSFVLGRERIRLVDEICSFDDYELNSWQLQDDHSSIVTSNKLDCKYVYKAAPAVQAPSKSPMHHSPNNIFPMVAREPINDACTRVISHTPPPAPVKLTANPKVLTSNKVPVMPWMKHFKLRDAKALFDVYKSGTKISVQVDDFIKSDDDATLFTVTGNTLDDNRVPVAFNVAKTLMDSLTNPDSQQVENAVFEITINHNSWTRTDKESHRDIDDADGVLILLGREPLLRFDGRGHGSA